LAIIPRDSRHIIRPRILRAKIVLKCFLGLSYERYFASKYTRPIFCSNERTNSSCFSLGTHSNGGTCKNNESV
jgi:hypothetical protein